MINKKEIEGLCVDNGYQYNYFGDNIVISTTADQWMIEKIIPSSGKAFIKLKHRNKSGNKTRKEHFHTQGTFKNIKEAVNAIKQHEGENNSTDKLFNFKNVLLNNCL